MRLPEDVLVRILHHCDLETLIKVYMCNPAMAMRMFTRNASLWATHALTISSTADMQYVLQKQYVMRFVRILRGVQLGPVFLRRLPQILTRLHHLDLSGCINLTDDLLRPYLTVNMQSLVLDGCQRLTNWSMELIISSCPNLTHLSLKNCLMSNAGIECLEALPRLERLNLSRCYLVCFSRLYLRRSSVSHLDLSGNHGLDVHAIRAQVLRAFPNLCELILEDIDDLTVADIKSLEQSTLVIRHNAKLQDDSAASIRSYLMSLIAV